MRLSSIYIGLVLFFSCWSPAQTFAGEYFLDDLYRIALERSEKIRIAQENVNFAELEKKRAVASLMPRLSAFGNYQKYSKDKYNDNNILIQPDFSQQWGLKADQTLSLSLRELIALSEAKNDITRSAHDLASAKEIYLLHVAQAYYTVLTARKGLDISQSNLDRITKYRDAALTRLKIGEITKTVLLRAESELSGAKSELVIAQNALALANASLTRLVGIEPDFTLKDEQPRQAQTASLSELKETAFSQRADLKSLEYQVKIAGQEVSFAKGAYWPNLTIAGVYQKNDQDPETASFNNQSTYGALSLNFPFFEGGLRRAEVEEAKVRERQAVLTYEDQKKTAALEVESAYLDLTASKGTLKHLEDQAAFAQDNYRAVSRQFALGLASSIDVIDANSLLVSSERQLTRARYSYQLAILEVERATGVFLKDISGNSNTKE